MRTLELILPGLLGPIQDRDAVAAILPAMPALGRLLARSDARASSSADFEVLLGRAFGVAAPEPHLAPLARLGEADAGTAVTPQAGWVRADPVHLRIDMTHARLFGAPMLGLDQTQADALVGTIKGHLEADGVTLEAPAPDRWYIGIPSIPDIRTFSPTTVAGRNVDHFLPRGPDGAYWRGLMNEVQMLLHEHPVNTAREARGELPVNSIWVWGAGALPEEVPQPPDQVFAADPIAHGLATLADATAQGLPASVAELAPGEGRTLLADSALRDPLVHGEAEAWLGGLQAVEDKWLAPALAQLHDGRVDRLVLRTGGAREFHLSRAQLRYRIWRREHQWSRWMEAETTPGTPDEAGN